MLGLGLCVGWASEGHQNGVQDLRCGVVSGHGVVHVPEVVVGILWDEGKGIG